MFPPDETYCRESVPANVLVQIREESIKEIFGDQYVLIKDFIKKEKINLKDESDLVRLIKFYDGLVE